MALLHGRPGTGKTTVSRIILEKYGYQVVEVNASDNRTYKEIMKVLDRVCLRKSITGKAALLLEEIDGAYESEDGRSSITAIADFLKKYKEDKNKTPIITTCNVTHKANVKQLYPFAVNVSFPKLFDSHLRELCTRIAKKYDIRLNYSDTTRIVQQAQGDARQIIQSLRMISFGGNRQPLFTKDDGSNIFEVTKTILNGWSPQVSRELFHDCGGYGMGLLFENYPKIVNWQKGSKKDQMDAMDELSAYADTLSMCEMASTVHHNGFAADMAIEGGVQLSKSVFRNDSTCVSKCSDSYFKRPNFSTENLWSSYVDQIES